MIVKKVRSLKGIYLDRAHIAFQCGEYTLYVVRFGQSFRFFLKGEFVAYEIEKSGALELSEIVGLIPWLESEKLTAKYKLDGETELILPCWYHKLPSVSIKF